MSFISVKSVIALIGLCSSALARTVVIDFESLSEHDIPTNQCAGLGVAVAGSPTVFPSSSLLNEIDSPPHHEVNVLVDAARPARQPLVCMLRGSSDPRGIGAATGISNTVRALIRSLQ